MKVAYGSRDIYACIYTLILLCGHFVRSLPSCMFGLTETNIRQKKLG